MKDFQEFVLERLPNYLYNIMVLPYWQVCRFIRFPSNCHTSSAVVLSLGLPETSTQSVRNKMCVERTKCVECVRVGSRVGGPPDGWGCDVGAK